MSVASAVAGLSCIAAAVGYALRFVLLNPEASAWPQANAAVRVALVLLAGVSGFTGLQALAGVGCVTGALAAFMAVHGLYSIIMALNLLLQRHVSWLDLGGHFRSQEPTNAAG